MLYKYIFLFFLFFYLILPSCSTEIEYKNPWDKRSPVELQVKGGIKGYIYKEGEEKTAKVHGGITIVIDELPHFRTETEDTGLFNLTAIPAGNYHIEIFSIQDLRYRRMYIEQEILVNMGETIEVLPIIIQKPPEPVHVLSAKTILKYQIELKWEKSLADDLKGYFVYMNNGNGFKQIYFNNDPTDALISKEQTKLTIDNLSIGVQYEFYVTAVDNYNLESAPPNEYYKQFIYPSASEKNPIILSGNTQITDMIINEVTNTLYIGTNNYIRQMDLNTYSMIDTFKNPDIYPESITSFCFNSEQSILYVLSNNDLFSISTNNNNENNDIIKRSFPLHEPIKCAVSDDGAVLFVYLRGDDKKVITLNANDILMDIIPDNTEDKTYFKIHDSADLTSLIEFNKNLYITLNYFNTLTIIDADIQSSTYMNEKTSIEVGLNPTHVTTNTNSDYLIVVNSLSNDINIFNKNTILENNTNNTNNYNYDDNYFDDNLIIEVGFNPQKAAIFNDIAYVTNENDNTVSVISLKNTPVPLLCNNFCKIKTNDKPKIIVVNENSNELFVSGRNSDYINIFEY